MSGAHFLFLLAITTGYLFTGSAGVVEHIVGGALEWSIPPNAAFYEEWARSRTFALGDKLVFNYRTGSHDVVEVPKEDYEKCTLVNMIDTQMMGPSTIALDTAGTHYYYCGIGTHCSNGMKLAVEVGGSKSAKPNATSSGKEAGAPAPHAKAAGAPAPHAKAAGAHAPHGTVAGVPAPQELASAPAKQDVTGAAPETQERAGAPETREGSVQDKSDGSIRNVNRFIVLVGFIIVVSFSSS